MLKPLLKYLYHNLQLHFINWLSWNSFQHESLVKHEFRSLKLEKILRLLRGDRWELCPPNTDKKTQIKGKCGIGDHGRGTCR